MTLRSVLKRELKSSGLTIKTLRNNPSEKLRIIDELVFEGVLEKKSQRQIFRDIRALGISFANDEVRPLHQRITKYQSDKTPNTYFTRLREDVKPNRRRLHNVDFDNPQGKYYYGFTVYGIDKNLGKDKIKLIPRKVGAPKNKKYNKAVQLGFWSDELLTKKEARAKLRGYKRVNQIPFLTGSDIAILVGLDLSVEYIKITKLLRATET